MKRSIKLIIMLLLLSFTYAKAQAVKYNLYRGTIDNKAVILYIESQISSCGGDREQYRAIYRYSTKSSWIQLSAETNFKGSFSMTEYNFTGVMILQKTGKDMEGIWISPDAKKQFKVKLYGQPLPPKEKEKMTQALEDTNYSNNDC